MNIKPTVFGVGINDSTTPVTKLVAGKKEICKYYQTWHSMIRRCYSPVYQNNYPAYNDCSVVDEWRLFSNFRGWMINKDWAGKELDKDILIIGNREYSGSACCFVNKSVNALFNYKPKYIRTYLLGVHFCSKTKKYVATIRINARTKSIGYFVNELDAHAAYIEYKIKIIRSYAKNEPDENIKNGLLRHATHLRDQ